ncbi:hypothetical protein L2E82_15210 [Cichorium intybus]|uniref:Uncharacterized protein n=1 Tax=Cichorium intybus TaxID=13427 RepID=A0ACB9F334_CICIN|nr:hypothetical protein L2E82_15210 [Cichorium intybus]
MSRWISTFKDRKSPRKTLIRKPSLHNADVKIDFHKPASGTKTDASIWNQNCKPWETSDSCVPTRTLTTSIVRSWQPRFLTCGSRMQTQKLLSSPI